MIKGAVAMARRLDRLCRRVRESHDPIVWLRGVAGSGKTRLLHELDSSDGGCVAARARRGAAAKVKLWSLDDPSPATLQTALDECASERGLRRLVIASRVSAAIGELLLIPRLYGDVDIVDDGELFLGARDAKSSADTALLAASSGWPVLVDGYQRGSADMFEMLPAFLEREVLPDLPQAVVTALFAALPAALPAAAVQYLFGAETRVHPLFARAAAGMAVASPWVSAALLQLCTRPKRLRRAVLDDLIHVHTVFADPVAAVTALLDIGQVDQALEVFDASGAMFFGYRHGYHALEKLLEAFGPERERRTETLFLARMWLLMKSGQPREALLRLEAQHPGLPVDLRRLRLSHRPYALLVRLDISLEIDETPPLDVIASWGRLAALLPATDMLARGLLFNTMAIGFLQADAPLQARQLSADALDVYERAGSPYLAHFMLLHLCELSVRQGSLRDAAALLRRAEEALRVSGLSFNSEPAIIECFKSRIAYEEGRFVDCPADIDCILQALLSGDSWPHLISTMAGHFVFTAFWQHGLRQALNRLEHCALTLSRRHGPTQSRSIQLMRIRLYQVARRPAEAQLHLEEYDLEPAVRHSSHLATEESLIRLRQLIARGNPEDCVLQRANDLATLPRLETRHKISLGILQSHVCNRRGELGLARQHLGLALRSAEAQGLLGVLVEDGEFLERLLPIFIAEPGAGNARVAAYALRVKRLLHALPCAPLYSKALAGISRQEHRVLSYLSDGYTNKQIARALGLSESTVKFHLRNLFRKLAVSSRGALCEAVHERGIKT